MEDHTNPKFLYPIEFMKDGEKYYFERECFAFIRKGNSPETTVVSIYVKKHACGSILFEDNGIYLIKTKGKFKIQYPLFMEINFDKESLLQESEWIFLKRIKNVSFSCEDKEEDIEESVNTFDPYAFDNYKRHVISYIDGPQFYINKHYVDENLDKLIKLLNEYLDHFQEKRNIKDFLEEMKFDKIYIDEDMADGERKDYKIRVYDQMIEIIKNKIKEINQKESGKINRDLSKDDRPYKNMDNKDLEKALNEAIEMGDKQKMMDLNNELEKRNL